MVRTPGTVRVHMCECVYVCVPRCAHVLPGHVPVTVIVCVVHQGQGVGGVRPFVGTAPVACGAGSSGVGTFAAVSAAMSAAPVSERSSTSHVGAQEAAAPPQVRHPHASANCHSLVMMDVSFLLSNCRFLGQAPLSGGPSTGSGASAGTTAMMAASEVTLCYVHVVTKRDVRAQS